MKPEIKILDSGYIKLIETWGSDERFIEAARMSTGKGFKGWDEDEKLLAYLYNNKHSTPFEMSARYIPLPNENYAPTINRLLTGANTITNNKQAQGTGQMLEHYDAQDWLDQLDAVYERIQKTYENGIEIGIPKELARLPVPVARYSRMRASANLRNWLAFLTLRKAPAAQWEIRQYADAVGEIIAEYFPRTWELFSAELKQ